jgi:hypothetical protein
MYGANQAVKRKIFSRFVMRNATLPQITRFALGFAALFSGALITEAPSLSRRVCCLSCYPGLPLQYAHGHNAFPSSYDNQHLAYGPLNLLFEIRLT